MRTSLTHPLVISEVKVRKSFGGIGITFCPGKKQRNAATGSWDRDLNTDLDSILEWNASAIITLLDSRELISLQVEDLGAGAEHRNIHWCNLPIADGSIPDAAFETQWERIGEGLRARLRDGFNVLVHCKGGLGRAGTIAARLLIELGWDHRDAVRAISKVRPGAIENSLQMKYVMDVRPVPEMMPDTSLTSAKDRALGAMLGLAVGDAVGTTLEFKGRDSYPLLTDMVGGGSFRLIPGQWTDDTAMALALAESLLSKPELDETDLMDRFVDWRDNGTYSCTGKCFDIGVTVSKALLRYKRDGNPIAGSAAPNSAGNGSLMRLAPVVIRFWRNGTRLRDAAARQSRTTHRAAEAIEACMAFSELLADAIAGRPRSQVLRVRRGPWAGAINEIIHGSWRGKSRAEIRSTGYVIHSLEAAIWCVGRTGSFEEAVLLAANLGGDADTTAAITGQLAGALYGAEAIPARWRARLAWAPRIKDMATFLFNAGCDDRDG